MKGRLIENGFEFAGPREAAMRLAISVAICIVTLYLVDAYFFNGVYFRAVEDMASQLSFSAK